MDVLRAALGEETLSYFGASYGTKLGATYAELFPDRVGRLVLDGAVDVSIDFRTTALEQAAGFETALRAYVQNCLDSTDNCFLGDSVEEGLATISDFLDSVEENPLPAGDRELQVGNAFYGIVTPLYNRDYWFLLSTALSSALDGQGSALMELLRRLLVPRSRRLHRQLDGGVPRDQLPRRPELGAVRRGAGEFADFEAASPTFGRVFAWSLTACSGMEERSSEEPLDIRGEGAAPLLVLGTTRDPATPLKWAEALAAQLDSAVLLRRDGDGHTAYNAGNECIDTAVEDYLIHGTVPADPTDC